MQTQKWLYFATQADEANLNGIDDAVCLPVEKLVSIAPSANNAVTMTFKSIVGNDALIANDTVVLTTVVGDAFEVANELVRYINGSKSKDGFIVIADDTVISDHADAALADLNIKATYAHPSITGVASINVNQFALSSNQYPTLDLTPALHPSFPLNEPVDTGAFTVNHHYNITTTASRDWKIPSSANGQMGDWISIFYTAAIGDGNAHNFTTLDTEYSQGSILHVRSGSSDGTNPNVRIGVVDISASAQDVINITGATNGDGGVGTKLLFRNVTGGVNGWACEVVVEGQGDTSVASADTGFTS
jgi:hypothetical protein